MNYESGRRKKLKKKQRKIGTLSIILSLLLLFSLFPPAFSVAGNSNDLHQSLHSINNSNINEKMGESLLKEFEKNEQVTFLLMFKEQVDTEEVAAESVDKSKQLNHTAAKTNLTKRSSIVSKLKGKAIETQHNVKEYLEKQKEDGSVDYFESLYIVNAIAVTGTREVAEDLSTFSEIDKILLNETYQLDSTAQVNAASKESDKHLLEDTIGWNLERIGAPEVWDMGIDGSGIVVATIGTGVDWEHPALKEKYRGYDPSNPDEPIHEFNWYDNRANEQSPIDHIGHGTKVMGAILGGEEEEAHPIGTAPGAKWIAVNAYTHFGTTNDFQLLLAGEWLLAPKDSNGIPHPEMAPDIINNAWEFGIGENEFFRPMVRNWIAAGILPVFQSGDGDPTGDLNIPPPGNYPEVLTVGATDENDELAPFSLRGPSPYGEIKPDISAPGVHIRTSAIDGEYEEEWESTAASSAHMAGAAAMLLQVDSTLSPSDLKQIFLDTATPLTDENYPDSPNNGYGYGLLNAYEAVQYVTDGVSRIQGEITEEGEDLEPPTYQHEPPTGPLIGGTDQRLTISVQDNVSVKKVELQFRSSENENWETVTAFRLSGDHKDGIYRGTFHVPPLPESMTYKWKITDYGNNTVESDPYTVDIYFDGITLGYFMDFETGPVGWSWNGDWELGAPTSGPGKAYSGENVYATKLESDYGNNRDDMLMTPPIYLPDGEAYLQFKQWYAFDSGDYASIYVSTDNRESWESLLEFTDSSSGWVDGQVDLSDYTEQFIYIGFHLSTDDEGTDAGWYLDDMALTDTPLQLADDMGKISGNSKLNIEAHEEIKGKIDQNHINKSMHKPDDTEKGNEENIPALPIDANVNILETERSVNTNPTDGSYSLIHPAGTYTIKADAYGFYSETESVVVPEEGAVEANLTLQPIPKGTLSGVVTSEHTGEPVTEATLLLIEDAAVSPVKTDDNGNYSIEAYEGEYTMQVIAPGFESKEIEISISGNNDLEQHVELTPALDEMIGYDDGTAENAYVFSEAGNGWAVKMSLPEFRETATVTEGIFQFHDDDWPIPGSTEFSVEVWDATGQNGMPGDKLAGPFEAEAIRDLNEWTVVDLREHDIMVDGDFYMVYIQADDNPYAPGLATDEDGPYASRSYQQIDGVWAQANASEGNYMIRSRVSYEMEEPMITSPANDHITNEENITVQGTAPPNTTVQLMNNEENAGSAISNDEGEFEISIELTEGENELTAISMINDNPIGESDPVTVTLDTAVPELTIENPKDGEKTNRETITAEGKIDDDNLDYVEVNGQRANVNNGEYSKRIILENGQNVIEVVAVDKAGNTTNKSVTIQVKYDKPIINNLSPAENKYLETGESIKIEFDSEPGLRATFVIHMPLTGLGARISNATELPMMELDDGQYVGYWTVPSNAYAEGAQIEVIVRDSFGNVTRELAEGKLFINTEE
jgi:bacillopeptidase F